MCVWGGGGGGQVTLFYTQSTITVITYIVGVGGGGGGQGDEKNEAECLFLSPLSTFGKSSEHCSLTEADSIIMKINLVRNPCTVSSASAYREL